MTMKESSSFINYLAVVFKWRRFIVKIFVIVALVSAVISLMIPVQYTSTTTILPPNPQQDAMLGLMGFNIAGNMGGFSGLSSMLTGATTASDLFAAMLQSGAIRGQVIRKHGLKKVFKAKTMTDAHEMLDGITKIRISPEGIISVAVTWYDRNLAANIANSYIEELDRFNTETAMTAGKKYRMFIEKRLHENVDSLREAENTLRAFQEEHHTVALEAEIEGVIATIAQLKSEMILLEVKKAAIGSPGDYNNPHIKNINRQLRELNKQLSKIEFGDTLQTKEEFGAGFAVPLSELPEVAVLYARLFRDVEVQAAIYEVLTQQYEQAKIMELKDTPTVQILDKASPPEKKSIPRRGRIVVLASLCSLIFAVSFSFFLEWFEHLKTRPNEYKKLVDIRVKLETDVKNLKNRIFKRRKARSK